MESKRLRPKDKEVSGPSYSINGAIGITQEINTMIEQWMKYVLIVPMDSYEFACKRMTQKLKRLRKKFDVQVDQIIDEKDFKDQIKQEIREILQTVKNVVDMVGIVEKGSPRSLIDNFDETERKYQSYILKGQLVRVQHVAYLLSKY